MANMLRKRYTSSMGCCSHCDRKKPGHLKADKRERRIARAREKRQWRRQETS